MEDSAIISDERHEPPIPLLLREVTPKFVRSRRKRYTQK